MFPTTNRSEVIALGRQVLADVTLCFRWYIDLVPYGVTKRGLTAQDPLATL